MSGTARACFAMLFAAAPSCIGAPAIGCRMIGEMLAGTDNRKPFIVEKALNLKNRLNVLAAIQPMPAWAFYRLERGEFRLPIPQDESLCRSQAADFADAEQTLIRDW